MTLKNIVNKYRILALVLALSISILIPAPTHAIPFTVASGNDENTDNSSCSLSEAIENINDQAQTNTDCPAGDGNNDTINLPAGTITLTGDLPAITESIRIVGQSVNSTIVDGDNIALGFYADTQLQEFVIEDVNIENADGAGLIACATEIVIDRVNVKNSNLGAAAGGNCLTESITVTDSVFNNNLAEGSSEFAGLAVVAGTDCSFRPNVDLNRIQANGNGRSGGSGGGLSVGYVFLDNCGAYPNGDLNLNLKDVETNDNLGSIAAGTLIVTSGNDTGNADVIIDRLTSANNQLVGETEAEGGAATAGLSLTYISTAVLNNITLHNNSAVPDASSETAVAGLNVFALGSGEIVLDNPTITENTVDNADNVSYAHAGMGMVSTTNLTFTSFNTITVRNILATDNFLEDIKTTCGEEFDFGGGPVIVPLESGGGNIVGDDTCSFAFTEDTDQNDVTNLASTLGSFGNNGGFVQTLPLLEGSPAIDAGVANSLSFDARQQTRVQGGGIDSGAYESPFTAPEGNNDEDGQKPTLANTGDKTMTIILAATGLVGIGSISLYRTIKSFKHN